MLWFLFCNDDILLTASDRVPQGDEPPVPLHPWQGPHPLPPLGGEPCYWARLDAPVASPDGLHMVGLRQAFALLPPDHYRQAGKAREQSYWDQTTRFCGTCGAPMAWHTDISKRCTECGREVWPSPAVAMIVAVRRGDQLLMVQSRNFRADYMGLVAGFVETGESLEECVRREVWEETHIEIANVRYFASQPWPYPFGLMVGFKADYAGGELRLQQSELRKGGWFRADDMPPVPGRVSLARQLIDDFVVSQGHSPLSENGY